MGLLSILFRLLGVRPRPSHVATESRRDYTPPTQPPSAPTDPFAQTSKTGDKQLSGLDVDKFTPISTQDALAETKGPNWQSAFWDSMGSIPSAEIPRVRLIDRTMVGMGLITAEELVEIHELGEQMEQFRTDDYAVYREGQRAVAQSRQARAELKAQKKREAAERKASRRAEISQRRATDICFIGRGISAGLADRRSNVEKLNAAELPVLSTPAEMADALELSIPQLRWLAFHADSATRTHYVTFQIPKKSGGVRRISRPHRMLDKAQRWILTNILNRIPPHDAAHGFVAKRSIVTNAAPHVGQDIVLNVDLSDFFPSIHFYRVDGLFRTLGYSPAVAAILASLCTESPRETVRYAGQLYHVAIGKPSLPQGAATSPAISNLITRNLDRRLQGLADKLDWAYTRYADDITMSSSQSADHEKEKSIGYVLARLRHISADEGFSLNESKTRVLRRATRQVVTGLTVNDRVNVSRKTVRRLRAILHRAGVEGLEAQNRDNHPNFRRWLQGMIAFVEMTNPDQGRKLRAAFEAASA